MPTRAQAAPAVPRLTYLRIKNYRALRDVEFRDLTPLTVLIGPNGSGKSTVLDALDFLAEAVRGNLTGAWEKRERFRGMQTRDSGENIEFELCCFVEDELIKYELEVEENETRDGPALFVKKETITDVSSGEVLCHISDKYRGDSTGINFFPFLNIYTYSQAQDNYSSCNPDYLILAITSSAGSSGGIKLGIIVSVIRQLLQSYRHIHLTDKHKKSFSIEGPREKLSKHGDNLPNVLYYLHTKHPETLAKITAQLRRWVPGLADIVTEITSDERLLLRFKDAPFEKPLPAQYMSDGTMRLVALLTLLYEPGAVGLLGIEEPENELHPQLLAYLAEELIAAAETRQLLVASHSPALLNALEPAQVWILHRNAEGYTQATRTADLPGISAMVAEGSPLGYLWSRNFFDVGNPLDLPAPIR